MHGERKKVGVMLPSSNTTVEYDFQRIVPAFVSLHSARMSFVKNGIGMLERMNEDVETCAQHLGSAAVDVIAYACTGGSVLGGAGYDAELGRRVSKSAGGIPTVTTATAVMEALRKLGVRRVSVATPYPDFVNEKVQDFLQANGFEVLGIAGRGLSLNLDIGADAPETIVAFAREHLSAEADGLFLSCTNWRAMEVAERLEAETGRPVVTSNQATIWATFQAIGLDQPLPGYGRLFGAVAAARPGARRAAGGSRRA